MDIIEITDAKEAAVYIKGVGEKHPALSEVNIHVFRGSTLYVAVEGGKVVHVNVSKLGKRKKNIWEPFVNWNVAYTVVSERRKGYASAVAGHVRRVAIERGCRRLKSTVATADGMYLHKSLGDEFWGVDDDLVVVNTPLVNDERFEGVTPPQCPTDSTVPLSFDDVMTLLGGKKLRYDNTADRRNWKSGR